MSRLHHFIAYTQSSSFKFLKMITQILITLPWNLPSLKLIKIQLRKSMIWTYLEKAILNKRNQSLYKIPDHFKRCLPSGNGWSLGIRRKRKTKTYLNALWLFPLLSENLLTTTKNNGRNLKKRKEKMELNFQSHKWGVKEIGNVRL